LLFTPIWVLACWRAHTKRVWAYELRQAGHEIECQIPLPLVYKEVKLDLGYRVDLMVDNCVIVEVKAIEAIAPVHKAQLLSHLRLTGKKLGLLINFHVVHLKDGIFRVVNNL
jgi:GxxExxY protein